MRVNIHLKLQWTLAASSIASRIPVDIYDDGSIFLRAIVPEIFNDEAIEFELHAGGWTETNIATSGLPGRSIRPTMIELQTSSPDEMLSVNETLFHVNTIAQSSGRSTVVHSALMGIGGDSCLVAINGSVSLIKSVEPDGGGYLELGQSQESFAQQYCAPSSMLILEPSGLGFPATIRFNNQDDTARPTEVRFMNLPYMIGLPVEMISPISSILGRVGTNPARIGQILRFRDCAYYRTILPVISIQFQPNGTVVLYPEDYTREIEHGICDLLATVHPGSRVGLSFLRLPEVNFRFTRNETILCDANIL